MNKLNYFKGKPCTIYTTPVNRHFNEIQHTNTFVGILEEIDDFGIWIIHISNKKKSFFTHHQLVGIVEEIITTFSEDEAQQFHEQIKAKLPQKDNQQLISVESLKKLKTNQLGSK